MTSVNPKYFVITSSIIGPTDVSRLLREVQHFADFMSQSQIRKSHEARFPTPTHMLNELYEDNGLNLLQQEDRQKLIKALETLKKTAPVLHLSFAVDPSPQFMKRLIVWLRQEIHPYALVQVGLQPSLGAGCTLRTDNKYFDLSLRQRLRDRRDMLSQKLSTAVTEGLA